VVFKVFGMISKGEEERTKRIVSQRWEKNGG